MKLYFFELK